MEYTNIEKIVILGIGGKAAYYVVKFLHLLDIEIEGYDIKPSDRTKELESWGIKINYRNPKEGEVFDGDFFIYSNDLNKDVQDRIKNDNKGKKSFELGKFYRGIIKDFENGNMNKSEVKAFKDSNIGPLFNIDINKTRYISVTGTDGKTTTCTMIYHVLRLAGFKPALITTVGAYIGDTQLDTGLHTTTPSSQEIYELLKKVEEDCTHVIIEATSHGLEQGRLAGLKFDSIGYTNITYEHLDYHGDWNSYCNAKSLLITDHLKDKAVVVLNKDDKAYGILKKKVIKKEVISYSVEDLTDITAENIEEDSEGIKFDLLFNQKKYTVKLPMLGKYNVSNFLCALGICIKEGLEIENIIESILSFKGVEGRMEVIQNKPFKVIVDYAHTPSAQSNALKSVRLLVEENARLIHVFGSAGRRDFYKRPEMGKISNELADITILTAEDPRLEDLKVINDQIEKGWREGKNQNGQLIRFDYMDRDVGVRRDAISKALELARNGDVVIITGKAHEKSLCFGQTEYPWNDIDEVKALLQS